MPWIDGMPDSGGGGFTGLTYTSGSTSVAANSTTTRTISNCQKIIAADCSIPYGSKNEHHGVSYINVNGNIQTSTCAAILNDTQVRFKNDLTSTYTIFWRVYYVPS